MELYLATIMAEKADHSHVAGCRETENNIRAKVLACACMLKYVTDELWKEKTNCYLDCSS